MELFFVSVSLLLIALAVGFAFGHWRGYLVGRAETHLMRGLPPDKNKRKEVV